MTCSKTSEEGALNMLQYPAQRRRQMRHSIFRSKMRTEEALGMLLNEKGRGDIQCSQYDVKSQKQQVFGMALDNDRYTQYSSVLRSMIQAEEAHNIPLDN